MTTEERKALVFPYLGQTVDVRIDRPVGYRHKKHGIELTYEVNYGFLPGVLGGDGEELDVYVLGPTEPIERFTGRVIGIVFRRDDEEDKLIAAPDGVSYTPERMAEMIRFAERYYDSYIVTEPAKRPF
ncbi:MAG: inorganic diphosphatase [Clostridia bacterium]|nr:inorganic diphosphatase [Clostridia bacterium]